MQNTAEKRPNVNRALIDILHAIHQYRVWLHLGWLEVKQRYRRSVLGPWWISISMLIFIAAMSKIFSRLFHQNVAEYVPFFTAGFIFWSFISTSIIESTEIFKVNSNLIRQIKLPYTIYIMKFLVKNGIVLGHNFIIYFLVLAAFKINPGWSFFFLLPGFLLLTINLYWITLFIALISTRFRDIAPIVNSCIQILFFITPISWTPKLLGSNSLLVQLNPFVYLLDLVRNPLLGQPIPLLSWEVCTAMATCGLIIVLGLFNRVSPRIPFWLD
jgi:ABC-type polysaccharide/polyol phosphate export permease